MRWEPSPKYKPLESGDTRRRWRFALWPIRVFNSRAVIVWLEFYQAEQIFKDTFGWSYNYRRFLKEKVAK
jgi:hypothetical protein